MVRLLDALMPELGGAGRDLGRVFEGLGGTPIEAFRNAALEGESFREVLLKIIQDVLVLSQNSLGGGAPAAAAPAAGRAFATPTIPVAKGNVFPRGGSLPEALARGGVLHNGVVNRPTLFAMAKGYAGGAMRFGLVGVGMAMAG